MERNKKYKDSDLITAAKESLKRLKQETCPATYMPDFDKDKCIDILKQAIDTLEDFINFVGMSNAEDLKALDAILKHTTCDGWSNGYSTKYYEMNDEELKIFNKVYKSYKENK